MTTALWLDCTALYVVFAEHGEYTVKRLWCAGGKMYVAEAATYKVRDLADLKAAEMQRRVDGGMRWQDAER